VEAASGRSIYEKALGAHLAADALDVLAAIPCSSSPAARKSSRGAGIRSCGRDAPRWQERIEARRHGGDGGRRILILRLGGQGASDPAPRRSRSPPSSGAGPRLDARQSRAARDRLSWAGEDQTPSRLSIQARIVDLIARAARIEFHRTYRAAIAELERQKQRPRWR
jgi:hypothetical protein